MPQCAKCKKVFTRVEGLKKHLNVAGQTHCEGDVTASVGQAPQTVLRALPVADQPVHTVLANNAAFCTHVNVDWRRVAARTEYRQVLKEHCVLCGQWSSRVKQHLRQMHPECWRFRDEATSMCRSAGLAATAPCSYCDFPLRQPGRHLTSCPVVFQVALMRLLLQPGGPLHTPEDGSGDDGCGRAAGSAGAPGDGGCVRGVEEDGGASLSAEHDGTRVSGGGRPPKWRKDENRGKGPSTSSWEGWGSGSRGERAWKEDTPAEAGESKQTQELLKCLVKMSVRHEQELMRIRPDVGFIAFCDTSELGCVAMLQEVLKT